jgi:hypothetical protein
MPLMQLGRVGHDSRTVHLSDWSLREVSVGERYFVGLNLATGEACVSSRVVEMVPSERVAVVVVVVESGRQFSLIGNSGVSEDADFLWRQFLALNGVDDWKDITGRLLSGNTPWELSSALAVTDAGAPRVRRNGSTVLGAHVVGAHDASLRELVSLTVCYRMHTLVSAIREFLSNRSAANADSCDETDAAPVRVRCCKVTGAVFWSLVPHTTGVTDAKNTLSPSYRVSEGIEMCAEYSAATGRLRLLRGGALLREWWCARTDVLT